MSKISLPGLILVIGVFAAFYFLVTLKPADRFSDSSLSAQSEQEPMAPADCEKYMCYEVRPDGTEVITRGNITLQIPVSRETWVAAPPKEMDLIRVSVCFPGPGDPPPCEDSVPAYGFWLRESSLDMSGAGTPDERLRRMTSTYEGPVEGPVDGVSAYLSSTGRVYVLPDKDAMGHFVVATCYTECRVQNSLLPGVYADYRFPPAFIGQWPDLDRAIRHYIATVRVAE